MEESSRGANCPFIASEKCHQEKRKTVNGEDILFAMTSLGFENYAEALKIYLSKYRDVSSDSGSSRGVLPAVVPPNVS
jgi:nuclear transcription Y subunit beta